MRALLLQETDSVVQNPVQQAQESGPTTPTDSLLNALGDEMANVPPSLQMGFAVALVILLVLVLLVLPLVALKKWNDTSASSGGTPPTNGRPPLKGLSLPEGSVRSMLALLIVGSLLLTICLGTESLGFAYDEAVSILGTLAGSVLGFYFGSRGSQASPPPATG